MPKEVFDFYDRTSLKSYNLDKINETLKKHNKDITFRAENITMEEFIDISNNLSK